jgi:hypothetical protein
MPRVSDDPVVRARGYVHAAAANLRMAEHLLPASNANGAEVISLGADVEALYTKLGGVWD